jgi:hypothetical protein
VNRQAKGRILRRHDVIARVGTDYGYVALA